MDGMVEHRLGHAAYLDIYERAHDSTKGVCRDGRRKRTAKTCHMGSCSDAVGRGGGPSGAGEQMTALVWDEHPFITRKQAARRGAWTARCFRDPGLGKHGTAEPQICVEC